MGYGLFLDLGPGHDPLRQPGVLGQADEVGVLVRHEPDPEPPHDRAEVVAAGAAHGDRANDHQLVQGGGVGEFRDRRCLGIATAEDLGDVHLGDALGGVLGVVVSLGIDHQAFQHLAELALHLGEQVVHLALTDVGGDVVIGEKPLPGLFDAGADSGGDGLLFGVCRRLHDTLALVSVGRGQARQS